MLMFRYDIWFLLHLMVSSESLLVRKSVKREEEKKRDTSLKDLFLSV